jgi:hypothetical protein
MPSTISAPDGPGTSDLKDLNNTTEKGEDSPHVTAICVPARPFCTAPDLWWPLVGRPTPLVCRRLEGWVGHGTAYSLCRAAAALQDMGYHRSLSQDGPCQRSLPLLSDRRMASRKHRSKRPAKAGSPLPLQGSECDLRIKKLQIRTDWQAARLDSTGAPGLPRWFQATASDI